MCTRLMSTAFIFYIVSEGVYMAAYRYGTGALYLENIGVLILEMDRSAEKNNIKKAL